MVLCAECKRKSVYIDNSGQPAEFCSNQCRKTAVEQRHVQPCIKCRTWPMIRLPDGTRSPYCGKQCQNSAGANSPVGSPISPQSYRPASYPTMVQQNHPNPPIGMPPHQQLLPSGSARPSPWVMTTIPFCRYCQSKPCWNDPVKNLYSEYCSRRCKEAAKRAPRAVSNMNNALPQPNYNGQIISSASTDSSLLSSMSQYQLYHQTQPPPLPQRSPPSNTHYPSPNENSIQLQMNRYPKANDNPQLDDDLQQPQASDSSLNSNPSGHHFRYPNTDTPTSHPNSQVSDSQAPPPPIPTNKPTQTRPQQINMVPINTSVQSSPSSQLSTEIPSSSQAQAQEQNQSRSLVPSQSQVPNNSRPRSQSDELHPGINENTYILTPYGFNPESNTIDVPPPYTPNEAFTGNVAPGEDISIRKITRDDTYDDENPYGFRDANNNNSDEQEQNNNQSNNNQEQRTRMRWLR